MKFNYQGGASFERLTSFPIILKASFLFTCVFHSARRALEIELQGLHPGHQRPYWLKGRLFAYFPHLIRDIELQLRRIVELFTEYLLAHEMH
jgi:hypothetical protein